MEVVRAASENRGRRGGPPSPGAARSAGGQLGAEVGSQVIRARANQSARSIALVQLVVGHGDDGLGPQLLSARPAYQAGGWRRHSGRSGLPGSDQLVPSIGSGYAFGRFPRQIEIIARLVVRPGGQGVSHRDRRETPRRGMGFMAGLEIASVGDVSEATRIAFDQASLAGPDLSPVIHSGGPVVNAQ